MNWIKAQMLLVIRRDATKLISTFDLFKFFSLQTWIALFVAFLVYTLIGLAYSSLEYRYLHAPSFEPLNVSSK